MAAHAARYVLLLLLAVSAAPGAAQSEKQHRIGFMVLASAAATRHFARALEQGLRDHGYVEGRNLVVERRFADGHADRLHELAAELVRLRLDVIVTGANPVTAAVKQATSTIPIVMVASRNPIGVGFVASLSRPGGNVTGISIDPSLDIFGKNLDLLRQAVPHASDVALLWNPATPAAASYRDIARSAATQLGIRLKPVEIRGPGELAVAFDAMARMRAQGVVVVGDPMLFANRAALTRMARERAIPDMYTSSEYPEAGGLMSYGPHLAGHFRRAAGYVDKILRGASPGDLPVEQSAKFELVINLKTARALGLALSPALRLQADHVIE